MKIVTKLRQTLWVRTLYGCNENGFVKFGKTPGGGGMMGSFKGITG